MKNIWTQWMFSSICKITDCEGSSIIIKAFLCKRSLSASYWVTTPKGVGKENGNVLDSGWMDGLLWPGHLFHSYDGDI